MMSKYRPHERNQRIKIRNLKHSLASAKKITDSKTNAVTE